MIFIVSFLVGGFIGWYFAFKKYRKLKIQINKPYSQNNIQV